MAAIAYILACVNVAQVSKERTATFLRIHFASMVILAGMEAVFVLISGLERIAPRPCAMAEVAVALMVCVRLISSTTLLSWV